MKVPHGRSGEESGGVGEEQLCYCTVQLYEHVPATQQGVFESRMMEETITCTLRKYIFNFLLALSLEPFFIIHRWNLALNEALESS